MVPIGCYVSVVGYALFRREITVGPDAPPADGAAPRRDDGLQRDGDGRPLTSSGPLPIRCPPPTCLGAPSS